MARISLSLKTYQVSSFSIQDWKQGGRWVDAISGEPDIEWTRLPSGGERPWFFCPACGRRCGILYSIRSRLLCRKCGGLSYESQSEPSHYRALRKAQKIRVRLGGSANMTKPFPGKPRYMHQRTYLRLRLQYEAAVEQYVGPMNSRHSMRECPLYPRKRTLMRDTEKVCL